MRTLLLILCLYSCSKPVDKVEVVDDDTMVIWQSKARTDSMINELPKVDEVIHQEEARIEQNIQKLRDEVVSANVKTKVVFVHDTIVIKEKTNFWGRKRVSMDSMQSIDSTIYQ